ncbi:hypothetical protein ACA910_010673 [Epithemia clementina (nom. ined.)]
MHNNATLRETKVSFSDMQSQYEDDLEDDQDHPNDDGHEDDDNDDDDPRLSAAALCLSLRFSYNETKRDAELFGPEFTHQCFEGEYVPGYQPFERDILQKFLKMYTNDSNGKNSSGSLLIVPKHASHVHFADAVEYLRIKVEVAPSCAICKVLFETQHKAPQSSMQDGSVVERQVKRRRITEPGGTAAACVVQYLSEGDQETKEESSAPVAVNGKKTKTNEQQSKLSLPQVLERLKKMLPDIVELVDVRKEYLAKPFGEVLYEYTKDKCQYSVCLAIGKKTPGVESYHNSVQRLALGWIETADYIDVTHKPHAGQYWQILYLFQKHSPDKYSLAGYMTLWTITSLLARPQPGLILRITQGLLLPHQQRCGHGQEMVRVIYKLAQGEYNGILQRDTENDSNILYPIVQVNVEDPSPGFTAMRDLVDYTLFLANEEWQELLLQNPKPMDTQKCELSMNEILLKDLASKAKITPRQVQIVHELLLLRKVQVAQQTRNASSSTAIDATSENDSEERRFRLFVKERLYKENKSMISELPSKDDMREKLAQLYSEVRKHYDRILNKAHGN